MDYFTVRVYQDFMWMHWRTAVKFGGTTAASPEAFFGFEAFDVAELHFHMQGKGKGLWFRLQDGRVFDQFARPDERDRIYYDAKAN